MVIEVFGWRQIGVGDFSFRSCTTSRVGKPEEFLKREGNKLGGKEDFEEKIS